MGTLSVGIYGTPDIFNQSPSSGLSLEAGSRLNSVTHCERAGARGQFKIVCFSQDSFFPEASRGFILKKTCEQILFSLDSVFAYCMFICYFSLSQAICFPIIFLDLSFSSILCFLLGLCWDNESACISGDVTQLHPKTVPRQDEGVSSLLPQKGIMLWSLR